MVAGKFEARGRGPNDVRFTLKEEIVETPENDTALAYTAESHMPVRLLGGRTNQEGRLQASVLSGQDSSVSQVTISWMSAKREKFFM
jgi:hypothetical protein